MCETVTHRVTQEGWDKASVLIPQMVPFSLAGREEAANYRNKLRQISNSSGLHQSLTGYAHCKTHILGLNSRAVGFSV